jgi:predicted nucleic acid-binding protein
MSASCFVDTNVFVYFRDASETQKQQAAEQWLTRLWRDRCGRLSFQVLGEYYVAVTERLKPGLKRQEARRDMRDLMVWNPLKLDRAVFEGAWEVQDRFGFSWWDSLIVSAAQRANCDFLLSEDLQDGQKIGALTISNPFKHAPDDVLGA